MSLTKNFEKRQGYDLPNYVYAYEDVAELLAHTRSLEAMLKKHEWGSENRCLECYAVIDLPHTPNCPLAKLIEGVGA